jgi:hypothetical protein
MATVVPVLWAGRVLGGNVVGYWFMRYAMPELIGFALFVLWSPQLLRGSAAVPWRSRVGLVLLTVLDGAALAAGWAYGLRYQGLVHTTALVTLNCIAAILCWVAFVRAYRHATFPNSLLFHASTAVWIVWLAFPWLGELP